METTRSPILTARQAVRDNLSRGSALYGSGIRPLETHEVARLEALGNWLAPGCQLWAGPGFSPETWRQNRLQGRLVLGAATVFQSTVSEAEIGTGAEVVHCPLVRRTVIGAGARVSGSSLDCSAPSAFGWGVEFSAGLETPGREVPMHPGLTLAEAVAGVNNRPWADSVREQTALATLSVSWVGEGCVVRNAAACDRFWLDSGCVVDCALVVDNSGLHAEDGCAARLGAGVHLTDSLVLPGASVDSSAQVRQSVLLEFSHAERGAFVTASLLGPNTSVAEGEVTACLLGPFVGFHHQSLLIAAWWPEGRGNVAYGANIGSNHTSRAPDQEIRPGEGLFFGLGANIKFPADFSGSPYSLLATGVTTLPQKMALPFSLVLDEPGPDAQTRGLNRVVPGWVLRENIYVLLRNEGKFRDRNRARRHQFDFRIFRPEVVDKMWTAWEKLASIPVKPVHTAADLSELGKNWLAEADRQSGVETYRRFLQWACARLWAGQVLEAQPLDNSWWQRLRSATGMGDWSSGRILQYWWEGELELWQEALAAKAKDDRRGAAVIPDYGNVHAPAKKDSFLVRRRQELDGLADKVKALVDNLWERQP